MRRNVEKEQNYLFSYITNRDLAPLTTVVRNRKKVSFHARGIDDAKMFVN